MTSSHAAAHIARRYQRHTKTILRLCASAREKRNIRDRLARSQGSKDPLKTHENEICSQTENASPTQSSHLTHPLLRFQPPVTQTWIVIFSLLNRASDFTSLSLTLREACSVTPVTGRTSPTERREEKKKEEQFMISHLSEQRRREK